MNTDLAIRWLLILAFVCFFISCLPLDSNRVGVLARLPYVSMGLTMATLAFIFIRGIWHL